MTTIPDTNDQPSDDTNDGQPDDGPPEYEPRHAAPDNETQP